MGLVEKLQEKDPKRNVVFIAIENIDEPEQMREFYKDYVRYLTEHEDDLEGLSPESVARDNVGYVVVYYGKETTDKWMDAVEGLRHPVFGSKEGIPWSNPEKAYGGA